MVRSIPMTASRRTGSPRKIGIALGTVRPERWAEVSCEADRLGYESVWMPEHLVLPVAADGSPYAGADHPPIPSDVSVFEPFAYLSYLAGRTSQIRFGTHIYNIGLRHPFVVARAVTTLDVVSGGRAEFGVGASWLEAEWDAVGLDFANGGAASTRPSRSANGCGAIPSSSTTARTSISGPSCSSPSRSSPLGRRCTSGATGPRRCDEQHSSGTDGSP